jgi:hypothetical protein
MLFHVRVLLSRKHLAKIQKREFTFMKVVYDKDFRDLSCHDTMLNVMNNNSERLAATKCQIEQSTQYKIKDKRTKKQSNNVAQHFNTTNVKTLALT